MKSIKEKAEENCIKYGNLGNVAYQEFEAGANYVLEQIEGYINRLEYGLNANCMVTAKNACECLRSTMEQLKK